MVTAKEQEQKDVTMGLMMELDVPQDVQDGRIKRVVLVELQLLLTHVSLVEPHALFPLGTHHLLLLHQLLLLLNKKSKNVNLYAETEK